MDGFFVHPPWQGLQAWGQAFAEFEIDLPDPESGLVLDWFGGMLDAARRTDGATYIVEVDGECVFRRHTGLKGRQPMSVNLTAFAGKRVQLRLITDPGPERSPTWDLSCWGDPIIRPRATPEPLTILSPAAPLQVTDGSGRSLATTVNGQVSTVQVAVPATVFLRLAKGRRIVPPVDLLAGQPRVGQVSQGQWRRNKSLGARADRQCAGVSRRGSIDAHPPPFGQTGFQYLLELPKDNALVLQLGYGVCGSFTRGVSFRVALDRRTIWRDDMPSATHRRSRISLSEFAGQDVLLELITDSMGEAAFDWAIWTEATLRTEPQRSPRPQSE